MEQCIKVKQLLSVILMLALVGAAGGTLADGIMATFFDTEVSADNRLCAGTRCLELSGGPVIVECAVPSKWYSEDFTLVNTGTLEGMATIHIPSLDDPSLGVKGVKCIEAGAKHGKVWDGPTGLYVNGTPIGGGVATSEPELVTEEGGRVGQMMIAGLGVDAGADSGPATWVMSNYLDIKIWFDGNGDGDFMDEGELIVEDKLSEVACNLYELGVIPPSESSTSGKGGGWGSYFQYHVGEQAMEVPLMAGQNIGAGIVTVWNDDTNLYVAYDTMGSDWKMTETSVYASTDPPEKLAPGKFPYKHESLADVATDLYTIPLAEIGAGICDYVYIVAHAVVNGNGGEETAWAKGEYRKMKIELHLQQVEDPACAGGGVDYDQDGDIDEDDAQKRWWPTNAFQGDRCTFDILFRFEQDCP